MPRSFDPRLYISASMESITTIPCLGFAWALSGSCTRSFEMSNIVDLDIVSASLSIPFCTSLASTNWYPLSVLLLIGHQHSANDYILMP